MPPPAQNPSLVRRQCLRFALYLNNTNQTTTSQQICLSRIERGRSKRLSKKEGSKQIKSPDGVVGPHADPVGDGAVLAHLLRQLLLDAEGLVGRLRRNETSKQSHQRNVGRSAGMDSTREEREIEERTIVAAGTKKRRRRRRNPRCVKCGRSVWLGII